MVDNYPKRPRFFAFRFCRLMAKVCLANEIGPEACWMLAVIAQCEDAKKYTAPVTYFNDQLMPLIGAGSVDTLDRIRRKAIDAGWLDYTPGRKGVAGKYFVTIPTHLCGLNDGAFDENPAEYYHPQPCGDKPIESAEESRGKAEGKCGDKPIESAEHSTLSLSCAAAAASCPERNGAVAAADVDGLKKKLRGDPFRLRYAARAVDAAMRRGVKTAEIVAMAGFWEKSGAQENGKPAPWNRSDLYERIFNAMPGENPTEHWPPPGDWQKRKAKE